MRIKILSVAALLFVSTLGVQGCAGLVSFGLAIPAGTGGQVRFWSPGVASPTEKLAALPIPQDGKLLSLAVRAPSNNCTGTVVFTLRRNGADTPLKVKIPAGSTTTEIITAAVDVAAGDLVALMVDATATSACGSFHVSFVYGTF